MKESTTDAIKMVGIFLGVIVALLIILSIPKFLGWLYDAPDCTNVFVACPKEQK